MGGLLAADLAAEEGMEPEEEEEDDNIAEEEEEDGLTAEEGGEPSTGGGTRRSRGQGRGGGRGAFREHEDGSCCPVCPDHTPALCSALHNSQVHNASSPLHLPSVSARHEPLTPPPPTPTHPTLLLPGAGPSSRGGGEQRASVVRFAGVPGSPAIDRHPAGSTPPAPGGESHGGGQHIVCAGARAVVADPYTTIANIGR